MTTERKENKEKQPKVVSELATSSDELLENLLRLKNCPVIASDEEFRKVKNEEFGLMCDPETSSQSILEFSYGIFKIFEYDDNLKHSKKLLTEDELTQKLTERISWFKRDRDERGGIVHSFNVSGSTLDFFEAKVEACEDIIKAYKPSDYLLSTFINWSSLSPTSTKSPTLKFICTREQNRRARDRVIAIENLRVKYALSQGVLTDKTYKGKNRGKNREKKIEKIQHNKYKECRICYKVNSADICFIPCGHVLVCFKCSRHMDYCPVCSSAVLSCARIHL